jgi:DinB superfamily
MEKTLARLESFHSQLLALVATVDDSQFDRRPAENEWSVAENVHHLRLSEARIVAELEKLLAQPPQPLTPLRRMIPMSLIGLRITRVKAPKFVEPLNPPPRQTIIDEYNAVRAKLKAVCNNAGRARLSNVTFTHPFFGNITGTAAVSMAGYHELRHYKQIREVIKRLSGQ